MKQDAERPGLGWGAYLGSVLARDAIAIGFSVANEGIQERNWHLSHVGFALNFGLLKHDAAITKAAARGLTKRTGDLLALLIGLPLLAAFARAGLSELSASRNDLVAYGVSALIATVLSKVLLEQVWSHQTEGALAHSAQRPGEWLCYVLPLLGAGILLCLTGMAVLGILHPQSAILGTGSGVVGGLAIPFVRERVRRWWRDLAPTRGLDLLRHKHAPMIGGLVSVAMGTICALLPQVGHLDAIATGGFGLVVILLTGRVDAATVRYMTLVGHSSSSLVRVWLPIQIVLLLPLTAVLLLGQNSNAAGMAAVVAAGLMAVTALRIFAYRAFSRLFADWIVAGSILVAGYAALAFPPLCPVVIIVAIVWLARRGSASRWLLT